MSGDEAMEGIFAYRLDAFVVRVACLPSPFGANKGLRWASSWTNYASYQVDSKTISLQWVLEMLVETFSPESRVLGRGQV